MRENASPAPVIRVMLVDDHTVVRSGLTGAVMVERPGAQWAGAPPSGGEFG